MKEMFRWNPYADQPHNVFPKRERLKHHFSHAGSYLSLIASNLRKAVPVLARYSSYKRALYSRPVRMGDGFAVSVSPMENRDGDVLRYLKETGVRRTLVRLPSWEIGRLGRYEEFCKNLVSEGFEVVLALLQNRKDVLDPPHWEAFLEEVFSRFKAYSLDFEIGHAWNRTKWGVWDHTEYLRLAEAAMSSAAKHSVRLIGPAVIDFEFHLYPPVMKEITFQRISSLLYVDRGGAPENTQFGWDTSKKLALLKAIVDVCGLGNQSLWITEVNWPLEGTGKYSPAAGRPNVSEEDQADYLVRYYILCLASGFVDRVYWWQLVAPGYGLIDSREKEWRLRPGYQALKTLTSLTEGAEYRDHFAEKGLEIFTFRGQGEDFSICWNKGAKGVILYEFDRPIRKMINRDGRELSVRTGTQEIDGSPKYIFYEY